MSYANQLGGLFVVGFEGTSLTSDLRSLLLDLKPAGVILFSRNVESPEQVAQFNHDLQTLALKNWSNGFFIGVDQEGGRVRRLRSPFLSCPSARQLARAANSETLIRSYSSVSAHQLGLLGFNTNFVPVLDLVDESSQDLGSVIGDRSYGNDPEVVTRYGKAVVESLRTAGIISCAKHFPGHGGTSVDSHLDLPIDTRSRKALESHDMIPFKLLAGNGVDMIMTAHVLYPALDAKLPATLSKTIVEGLLRGEIGYNGVVITDDLQMGAITNHYDSLECARLALIAGADLLLFSRHPEKTLMVRDGLHHDLNNGELPPERVAKSLCRVMNLKDRYESSMVPTDIYAAADYFRLGKQS